MRDGHGIDGRVFHPNLLATSIIIETPAYTRKLLWGHLQSISFPAAWSTPKISTSDDKVLLNCIFLLYYSLITL